MTTAAAALHPQLQAVVSRLDDLRDRVARYASIDSAVFMRRPRERAWSAAEAVQHLTMTTDAFLPLLSPAIAQGPTLAVVATYRYRADLFGRMLAWLLRPPYRLRMPTAKAFVPIETGTREQVLAAFDGSQRALIAQVHAADGRDLERIKVVSPFSASARYNIYAAFEIIIAHQERHLWQADRALRGA